MVKVPILDENERLPERMLPLSMGQDALDARYTPTDTLSLIFDQLADQLVDQFAGKADTSHDHTIADVTGLQDELDGKLDDANYVPELDHLTGLPMLSEEYGAVICTYGPGEQFATEFSPFPDAGTMAFRGSNGRLQVGAPTADDDAVTKLYVDTELDGKADDSHEHAVDDLTTTGTASSSTFLRGDGAWALPETAKNIEVDLDSDTDTWATLTIVDDGTATAGWPDRFKIVFDPQSGSNVPTFWLNEYGEYRGMPAKTNTVGFRVFVGDNPTAYSARDETVPVFEVSSDRTDRDTQFAVYGDGDAYVLKDLEVVGDVTAANLPPKISSGSTEPVSPTVGEIWLDTSGA